MKNFAIGSIEKLNHEGIASLVKTLIHFPSRANQQFADETPGDADKVISLKRWMGQLLVPTPMSRSAACIDVTGMSPQMKGLCGIGNV